MFHYHIQTNSASLCNIEMEPLSDEKDNHPDLDDFANTRGYLVIIPGTEWGAGRIHTKDEYPSRPHCPECKASAKMLSLNPDFW